MGINDNHNDNSHVVRYLLGAIRHQTILRDANVRDLVHTPRSRKLQRSKWYSHQHAIGLLTAALETVASSPQVSYYSQVRLRVATAA